MERQGGLVLERKAATAEINQLIAAAEDTPTAAAAAASIGASIDTAMGLGSVSSLQQLMRDALQPLPLYHARQRVCALGGWMASNSREAAADLPASDRLDVAVLASLRHMLAT